TASAIGCPSRALRETSPRKTRQLDLSGEPVRDSLALCSPPAFIRTTTLGLQLIRRGAELAEPLSVGVLPGGASGLQCRMMTRDQVRPAEQAAKRTCLLGTAPPNGATSLHDFRICEGFRTPA